MLPSACVSLKALAGFVKQLRCHRQIALGGRDVDMAEISCQLWQQTLHICSLAIPGDQAMYGGGMTENAACGIFVIGLL